MIRPFFQSGADGGRSADRLLLISYHFPPSRAAGALRWQKLARHAKNHGWGIDAITLAPEDVGAADEASLADLPTGTRVFGVRGGLAPWEPWEQWAGRVYKHLRRPPRAGDAPGATDGEPVVESFARRELPRFPRTRQDWRRAYQTWTYLWRERVWARRAASVALAAYDPAVHRAVVTCGPPHLVHEAGLKVAEGTGLPFVMDLRDPWSLVERLHVALASPVWYWVAGRREPRCIAGAALVVMNTDQARAAMAARYPVVADRIITVMNGWDGDVVKPVPADGLFRVMYAGSVYLDRDPRPLLRAAAMVVRDLHLAPDQFALDFVGNAGSFGGIGLDELAAREGIAGHVRTQAHLPRAQLLALEAQAAVLVSLPQDSHLAIPSKVFEYMGFPAWLLAFATPESAIGALLEGSGADVVRPGDVEGAAAALRSRYLQYRAGPRPEPLARQPRFTRRHQGEILFGSLERLLSRSRRSRLAAAGVR